MPPRSLLLLGALLLPSSVSAQVPSDTLRSPADSIIAYGWSTDADEARLLVGARRWPPPPAPRSMSARSDPKGIVFVYREGPMGGWQLEGQLESDDVGIEDCFSLSLDLRGDLAAIGAWCEYGPNPNGSMREGAVYLFRYDGAAWRREAKLYPSDVGGPVTPEFDFGEAVALGPDYLVVGAGDSPNPANPAADRFSGAAYVFERVEGAWKHTTTLVNDDAGTQINEHFGDALAATGDVILAGARNADAPGTPSSGAVYVFARAGGVWTQRARLTAPAPSASEQFGALLAADGTSAVIGTWGPAVYVAEEEAGSWHVHPRLPLEANPWGGVALSRDHVLAADDRSAYLFDRQALDVPPVRLPYAPAPVGGYEKVSLNSRYAFLGQPDWDENGYVLIYGLDQVVGSEPPASPTQALLTVEAAHPNPFRGTAALQFTLAAPDAVTLAVYDVLGRRVLERRLGPLGAGPHRTDLGGDTLVPGTYLARLWTSGGAAATVRLAKVE